MGDLNDRTAVKLSVEGKDAIYPDSIGVRGLFEFRKFKIQTTGSGNAIIIENAGCEVWGGDLDFGECADGHISVKHYALYRQREDYVISGSSGYHMRVNHQGSLQCVARTATIVGNPLFRTGFAFAQNGGRIFLADNTYKGDVQGRPIYQEDDGRVTEEKNRKIIGSAVQNGLPGNRSSIIK